MKILIIRLSAMGDVALSVPVIKALSEQCLDCELNMLTRKAFNPFFAGIKNLSIINPDFQNKHKGIFGLFKLYNKLKNEAEPDIIIDIHDVLRTKILRFLFILSGKKTFKIEKGRREKKHLCKKENKVFKQLKHSTERYKEVFYKAGLKLILQNDIQYSSTKRDIELDLFKNRNLKKIGIAPFAMHIQKQYPIEKMKDLIKLLNNKSYDIFIFGGGLSERKIAKSFEDEFEKVSSLIGKFSLEEEIEIMSNLDLMISMDSANMHIAALTGIKIVSIWGSTHPFAGFSPFIADEKSFIIQNENLDCRPCSVFGNKICYKKTLECFETIKPEEIVEVCENALKS